MAKRKLCRRTNRLQSARELSLPRARSSKFIRRALIRRPFRFLPRGYQEMHSALSTQHSAFRIRRRFWRNGRGRHWRRFCIAGLSGQHFFQKLIEFGDQYRKTLLVLFLRDEIAQVLDSFFEFSVEHAPSLLSSEGAFWSYPENRQRACEGCRSAHSGPVATPRTTEKAPRHYQLLRYEHTVAGFDPLVRVARRQCDRWAIL